MKYEYVIIRLLCYMGKQRRNDKLLTIVGQKLIELRKARGLSQQIVYIHTGIDMDMVERGKYNITLSTLNELCNYYKISMNEFFNGLENP